MRCALAAAVPACLAGAPAALAQPAPIPLDPTLPNGAAIFRSVCVEAGFSGARAALDALPVVPIDDAPISSIFAIPPVDSGSFLRGDPGRKSVDDAVVTLGTAEFAGVPVATCSVFSFVTPRDAFAALGATPAELDALAAPLPADELRLAPAILGSAFVGGVPGSRALTVLSVAGTAPDAPGAVASLDSVSLSGAARIAAAVATDRLFGQRLATYGEALREIAPSALPSALPETRP